jgi:hypothetical protein
MPESPVPGPSSAILLFAAIGGALVAVLLLASLTPRWTADEGTNWLITLLGGLVAGIAVYAVGALRKGGRTNAEPPR